MMRIGRHSFEVAQATFQAHIGISEAGWEVTWSLDIEASPREIDGQRWRPALTCHSPLTGLPSPDRLVGTSLGPLNEDEYGEPAFLLYTFEHEPARDVRLTFKERKDGRFHIELKGLTPSWDENERNRNVEVSVSCWAPLEAVVDENLESKARERLEAMLPKQTWGTPTVKHYKQAFPWRE
jgi:hypothetical protein